MPPYGLKQYVAEALATSGGRVIQPSYVGSKFDDHMAGRAKSVALIWPLLSLESRRQQRDVLRGAIELRSSEIDNQRKEANFA
jgi:hypothetical protein